MSTKKGLIMRSTGSWYDILSDDGATMHKGRLRGKFKLHDLKVTNPIAVGDYVYYTTENEQENTVVIVDIAPRENYIVRQSPHKVAHSHMLAANIDQALLIVTLAYPRTSLGFIDRFLVTAESFRIPVIILFNKSDILDQEGLLIQQELCHMYEQAGYKCLQISAISDSDLAKVEQVIFHKKTLVAGHSGVGKSTLINKLAPGLELATSAVSDFAKKGVHTTTFAEMFQIKPQTFIIDTPGIKELGLANMEPEEISHYFPEMRNILGTCRYHNCLHVHEPDCKVHELLHSGVLAHSRYQSYLSMLAGGDNRK